MSFAYGFGLPHWQPLSGVFSPFSLFVGGVQGAWYDPSDLTTLFQDSAGTTPVTAVEQPVGLMLDKSGRGNHAFQTTSASRPTLRARYNLVERSEEFDNAWWSKVSTTVSANAGTAPDGTSTADLIYPTTTGTDRVVYRDGLNGTSGISYTLTVYAKASGKSFLYFGTLGGGTGPTSLLPYFDLQQGQVSQAGTYFDAVTIQNMGSGWYRCTATKNAVLVALQFPMFGVADASGGATATTNGTDGILIWGAQLVPTAVFPSNVYQRIGAATDYATGAAFPPYLAFDGVDDSMLTNSVDFATVTSDGQARRNLLTNPTQFDAAGWTPVDATITANAGVAPDGSTTADKFTPNNTIVTAYIVQSGVPASAGTYTVSVYAKAVELTAIRVGDFGNPTDGYGHAVFNLSAGTVTSQTNCTATITNADNGWYRCAITRTLTSGTSNQVQIARNTVTGNGTNGVLIWGAQLETGSTATAFQNIGTDKMLVVAGVTKQSDVAAGIVAELSANGDSNNGAFYVSAAAGAASNYATAMRGTSLGYYLPATFAAPITNVVSMIGDIAQSTLATEIVPRINGTVVQTGGVGGSGTGNFGNYPLYIGRRNNATLPFNGNLYSLVIAGQSYSSGQISSTESWVAAKTPLGTI